MNRKRLKLNFWEFFCHYDVAVLLIFLGCTTLKDGLISNLAGGVTLGVKFGLSVTALGLWGCYKQYKRLFFKSIPIENLSKEEVFEVTKGIFSEHGWWINKVKGNSLVAEGRSFSHDTFDIRTYRNRITLLYEENNLFINCIVEPPRNGQFITFGKMNLLYTDFTDLFEYEVYAWKNEKMQRLNGA
ncbi:hypothetical protein ACFSC6_10950 [Rufibacter sediminis]|uniref:SMODS-associating 2TM beta-strand rich effector domain-containing protein n=1 Tax=Rufibacter sediminis TaxID=2762756 RepID=A0ABR6VPP1_9BACT|nr:hypothetical protein [Rufibacter sediminis]MBC3539159.1 hypothetical protein [Rufibacter sediminis]